MIKLDSNRGLLLCIEGTDSSGKETQSKILVENLNRNNVKTVYRTFPNYDSPTGKIIGGPYLGKVSICDGWFPEGADKVDPIIAAQYFSVDRRYNISKIIELLNQGYNVILDRYVDSNMAHQGGKKIDEAERLEFYKKMEILEYYINDLPRVDHTIFLHLPWQYSKKAIELREEKADQHEMSSDHLRNAELAYLEIAKLHDYITVDCLKGEERKTIEELSDEIYGIVKKLVK